MTDIFERIYKKHSKVLKNKNVGNKKLVICFSGIPGSGKTTISKKLEKKYEGVRINTKTIGKIIRSLIRKEGKEIQDKYGFWLMKNKPFKNNLIILDSGIDRKYKEIFGIAKKKGYRVFIIRLIVDENVLKERIKIREGKNAGNYFKEFERWKKEFDDFGLLINWNNSNNFVLVNDGDLNDLNLELLYSRLDGIAKHI